MTKYLNDEAFRATLFEHNLIYHCELGLRWTKKRFNCLTSTELSGCQTGKSQYHFSKLGDITAH